jgi:peptide/nickel transport system substrate-binding protein
MATNLTENLELSEILQYYWRQVGINCTIAQAAQAQVRERSDAGTYQVYPNFANWATGDPSRATSAFSGGRPATYNLSGETTTELANLWSAAVAEIDTEKRAEAYSVLQEKIKEQWVFFPLAHKRLAYVTTTNVEGFYPSPSGSPELKYVKVRN